VSPKKTPPRKRIPQFRSEDKVRAFWDALDRDSTEYVDWSKARLARFPNLPLVQPIRK
jgi:hypothetical protein